VWKGSWKWIREVTEWGVEKKKKGVVLDVVDHSKKKWKPAVMSTAGTLTMRNETHFLRTSWREWKTSSILEIRRSYDTRVLTVMDLEPRYAIMGSENEEEEKKRREGAFIWRTNLK
jgi:hypothetical protein